MRRGYELIGRDGERGGCHVKQYPLCCSVAILRSVESDVAVVDFCTSVFRVTCLLNVEFPGYCSLLPHSVPRNSSNILFFLPTLEGRLPVCVCVCVCVRICEC